VLAAWARSAKAVDIAQAVYEISPPTLARVPHGAHREIAPASASGPRDTNETIMASR
jgi:hypothetical protein